MSFDERAPVSVAGGILLTPHRAWCSGHDAAMRQMRKAGRAAWNEDDYDLAVRTQGRLLRHLGGHYEQISADMIGNEEDATR